LSNDTKSHTSSPLEVSKIEFVLRRTITKTPQGEKKLEEAAMKLSPTKPMLELSFVGRAAQVSLRGMAGGLLGM